MKKEDLKVVKGGVKMNEEKSDVLFRLNKQLDLYLKALEESKMAQLQMDSLGLIRELIVNMNLFMEYKYKVIALKNEIAKNTKK